VKNSLSYDDVLLVPQYSDIESRTEINLTTDMGNGLVFSLPIISSPMDTISESSMITAMSDLGAGGIIHRYNTIDEQCRMIKDVKNKRTVGAAIGISGDNIDRAASVITAGATFLCVDVAHGHHVKMKNTLETLRKEFGDHIHIMAGNVATLQGINDLADWGADSVRCNIGGGSICSTRIQTGHGVPGLETIFDCAKTDRDVKIIADGGIKNSGDIVKAFAAGADAVMCGSLFAGTLESPGEVFEESSGTKWKVYRGMASKEAQINWKGNYSSYEGVSTRVPFRGSVKDILSDLERGIRSGLSYSGARTIPELASKAEFIAQTTAGLSESRTHILSKSW
jgi:IMP dehydrogenase